VPPRGVFTFEFDVASTALSCGFPNRREWASRNSVIIRSTRAWRSASRAWSVLMLKLYPCARGPGVLIW